jgi:FMN-dependent NADH-azoreductase
MKTLLVVEVSPRLEFSVSRNLTARFVEQWKRGNPHGVVGDIGGKQMEPIRKARQAPRIWRRWLVAL